MDQHLDHHYAVQTPWGRPVVNSCITLALVTGPRVLEVRESRSRPQVGVVTVRTSGVDQRARP
jgi:acyl dehydratase